MENYQGDLTDILRATTSNTNKPPPPPQPETPTAFTLFNKFQSSQAAAEDDFSDPFSNMLDPLLGSSFFFNSSSDSITTVDHDEEDDQMMGPSPWSSCDMFSRALQISQKAVKPLSPGRDLPVQAESLININVNVNVNNSNNNTAGLQIYSPRNPAIKRRKSQAKKVVCIPAPTPVNSRPSGEIVPSDLWAWRKYGQKPIKGSPYPRGYYRCSSSKGCSARKQVERSRTDPNMLVITYTSEHNHPWPTQRNALAGSTRAHAQPSKTIITHIPTSLSEVIDDVNFRVSVCTSSSAYVKDEKREGFSPSYKPTMPDSNSNYCDDFFAELEEIETCPIRILLNQEDNEENNQINYI